MNWVIFAIIYGFILVCVWGIKIGPDMGIGYKLFLSVFSGVIAYFIVAAADNR